MKKSVIDKINLFENMGCGNPQSRYIRNWLTNAEFDLDKNLVLINDNKSIFCFQNVNPEEQDEYWEDEFLDFCELLLEEYLDIPLEGVGVKSIRVPREKIEGDLRVFCGLLEVIDGK